MKVSEAAGMRGVLRQMHLLMIGDISGPAHYHVGDEAMIEANIVEFRRQLPEVRFTLVSRDPEWSARQYGCQAIAPLGFPSGRQSDSERRRARMAEFTESVKQYAEGKRLPPQGAMRETIEAVASADATVVSGGGNLCSTWPEHLYERVALLRAAAAFGKPALMGGQTLGPELSNEERDLLGPALAQARLVGVREYNSLGLALSLGVRAARVVYQLDDAVFLPGRPVPSERFGFDFAAGDPWIAITVAPFFDYEVERSTLADLAEEFRRIAEATGARLVFIPHVTAPQEGQRISDVFFGRRLTELIGSGALMLDVCTAPETVWLTAHASMVISSRYHPVVFGLAAGVPSLGIVTDHYTHVKIGGALLHAGLREWSIFSRDCFEGGLSHRALELWRHKQAISQKLAVVRPKWFKSHQARWRLLLEALEHPPTGKPAHVHVHAVLQAIAAAAEDASWLAYKWAPAAVSESRRSLNDELKSAKFTLAACSDELRQTGSILAAREPEPSSVRATLLAREQELVSVKSQLAERERELPSVKSVLAARDAELSSLRPVLLAKEQELASIKPVVAAREDETRSLRAVLTSRDEELASIKPVLASRDEELSSLKPILSAKERELAAVKTVLREREGELVSVKEVLISLEQQMASIQSLLAERERLLASVKLMLSARDDELASLALRTAEPVRPPVPPQGDAPKSPGESALAAVQSDAAAPKFSSGAPNEPLKSQNDIQHDET